MKTLLYVCAHNPYPARSGGQVDIWNRLLALQQLGLTVDLLLTVKQPLTEEQTRVLSATVRQLVIVQRSPLALAVFRHVPVQVTVRERLSRVDLGRHAYDLVLLDNEFCGAVLDNPTLCAGNVAIRVHNDEPAYQRKLADTAQSRAHRLYFGMEAQRMARYIPALWTRADALWFISSDDLEVFRRSQAATPNSAISHVEGRFLPASLNLQHAGAPSLASRTVLFVGTLSVALNQQALRWYLAEVHPRVLQEPGYELLVAGSTMGHNLSEFCRELESHERVRVQCNVPDLEPLFAASAVFVSPMRSGAGVKLKTVEAALRGLPLVTTSVGAEGTGLLDEVHCCVADDPQLFADAVRTLLRDPAGAAQLRDRARAFIQQAYDHAEGLRQALHALGKRGGNYRKTA